MVMDETSIVVPSRLSSVFGAFDREWGATTPGQIGEGLNALCSAIVSLVPPHLLCKIAMGFRGIDC